MNERKEKMPRERGATRRTRGLYGTATHQSFLIDPTHSNTFPNSLRMNHHNEEPERLTKPPRSLKRLKTGCLCCRKRKIKCDGQKPTCKRCAKSSYQCVWPHTHQSLPHNSDFQLTKTPAHTTFFNEDSTTIRKKITQVSDEGPRNILAVVNQRQTEDSLFRKYLQEVSESSGLRLEFSGYGSWISGVTLNEEDALLYNAFLHGFIVSVSPQLAHKKLQPGAVFIPPGTTNPIVRSVFYACGAAFLCWHMNDMAHVAEARYNVCVDMLYHFIRLGTIRGNEDWLIVSILCLCIRERFYGGDVALNMRRLSIILEILRAWIEGKGKRLSAKLVLDKSGYQSSDDSFDSQGKDFEATFLYELFLEKFQTEFAENTLDKNEGDQSEFNLVADRVDYMIQSVDTMNVNVEACERTIIESFLYNYSVNLFGCDKDVLHTIPSPFVLFKAFRSYIIPPIYQCRVPWMNNPVMGASLPAFEIAAKATWISLDLPLCGEKITIAQSLLKSAKYYTMPIVPGLIKAPEPANVQRLLLESCIMADLVSKASVIFLTKILYPSTPTDDPEIQGTFASFKASLGRLSISSQISSIFPWPLAIAGVAAISKKDQDYLVSRTQNFLKVLQSSGMVSVLRYLKLAWAGPGINVLLDKNFARHVFL